MKLFVTVFSIEDIRPEYDAVELRAENLTGLDLHALRAATAKPILLTYRGSRVPDVQRAVDAGIDYVDVEWHEHVEIVAPERTVLSHHDYEGMRDVEAIFAKMKARGCAYTKLAATPLTFADNERLLKLLPGTVIGMGERGLYSRILAPFLGSELVFVAANTIAAPGQLTLERALQIYSRAPQRAERVFAIVGNPAGHSLSPTIHNRLFREKGVNGAYTIASIESFAEITEAFLRGEPCGLSVTAPFKEVAFDFARDQGAEIGSNALRARAVNTLVNVGGRIVADNTDVDGFRKLLWSGGLQPADGSGGLKPAAPRKAAVVGAGATARAALVALDGIPVTVFNRTVHEGMRPLDELQHFDGDLVINTLPGNVALPMSPCDTYIEAAYGGAARDVDARVRIGGLELLHAQAVRQHELFMKVFE
ncbi:MAG TPA: type I 3-dehydroquinate dehydratase [Thermoanaerobaculia bacterium]|nr:type I 3-dehydroquinate dehydratase [Thermoanaerobaculia bacterium]